MYLHAGYIRKMVLILERSIDLSIGKKKRKSDIQLSWYIDL